jgi:hypothetical protein
MPDLFEQRRDEHLKKSQAFLQEANNLFRDDLLYRSALADAVSAIKHSLQAYLWMRVGAVAAGEQRQRWQEVALDGSMPPLLRAAGEAGLPLGDSDRVIRELNDLRNQRTHDSPRSPITPEQAARAVQIARAIRDRVVVALPGQVPAVATRVGARSAADPVHIAPGQRQPAGAAAVTATTAPAPVGIAAGKSGPPTASVSTSETEADEEAAAGDGENASGESPVLRQRGRGWRRFLWPLATAAALIIGVAAGAAVTYPVAGGHSPAWLPFAADLMPAAPTATAQPTATVVPPGPFFAGALVVTPSGCGATPTTVTLHNTGASAAGWAMGSPDAPSATFALLTTGGASHPTLAGRLAPGASITLTVSELPAGGAHMVVIADGGTVETPLGTC